MIELKIDLTSSNLCFTFDCTWSYCLERQSSFAGGSWLDILVACLWRDSCITCRIRRTFALTWLIGGSRWKDVLFDQLKTSCCSLTACWSMIRWKSCTLYFEEKRHTSPIRCSFMNCFSIGTMYSCKTPRMGGCTREHKSLYIYYSNTNLLPARTCTILIAWCCWYRSR